MKWTATRLGDVLHQSRRVVAIEPGVEFKQVTVKMWGKGLTLRRVCDGSEIAASKQVAVESGNFLISKIDARHGAFGIVPDELDGAVVSNDFPCFVINTDIVVPEFLNWYTKLPRFVELCNQASKGSTNRVRLKEHVFLDLEIDLPPLKQQDEIAKALNGVQSDLNERQKQIDAVELETKAMLLNAFREIIDGADYRALSEVAPLVRRPVEVDILGDYPELGVRSFGKGTFHKPSLTGAEVGNKRLFEIHEGDLLFNIVFAWEGAIAVPRLQDHGRVGSHRFLTCVPDPQIATAEFLRFYLLSPEGLKKVGEASPGGAGRNRTLGIKKAERITVPCPSITVQKKFDQLCAQVDIVRQARIESAKEVDALIPAMLHQIFEKGSASNQAKQVAPIENVTPLRVTQTNAADTPFKEAVLVGAIVNAFASDRTKPLGNFRLQKAVYFARRHMGETALDQEFLRKAAGPYNPSMRYSGGIKIAEDKKWISRRRGSNSEGSVLGANASEMVEFVKKYGYSRTAAWVLDKFKYRKNDQWEILATVDYARLVLNGQGAIPTASRILLYIECDPEWQPKIKKLNLTEFRIQNALAELQSLFAD